MLSDLFNRALEIEDPAQRADFLTQLETEHPAETITEIKSLLEAFESSENIFDRPASVLPEIKEKLLQTEWNTFPKQFGNYVLLEEIGRGGMGLVFKARQHKLDRIVALKVIRGGSLATQTEVKRLLSEAQTAAHLNHPNIVPVFDIGQMEDNCFFTMAYIDGCNLEELISRKPFSIEQATDLMIKIGNAIAYAHENGVIHRDIKPGNVLIRNLNIDPHSPPDYVPLISDFGLAKRTLSQDSLTIDGQILGSPGFMAPEQMRADQGKNSVTTDIYALGALLYYVLTGSAPLSGESLWDVLQKTATSSSPSLKSQYPAAPKDLDTICSVCLDLNPNKRYQNAQSFVDDLQRFKEGLPILARPANAVEKCIKFCRRKPAFSLGLLTLSLIIITSILVPTELVRRAKKHNRQIEKAHNRTLHEQAKSTLHQGLILAQHDSKSESLAKFQKAKQIAQEIGDSELERVAESNYTTWKRQFWTKLNEEKLNKPIKEITISPKGDLITLLYDDDSFELRKSSNQTVLLSQKLPRPTSKFNFNPSQTRLVTKDSGNIIHQWDLTATPPKHIGGDTHICSLGGDLTRIHFYNDTTLITASKKGSIEFYDLISKKSKKLFSIKGFIKKLEISQDRKRAIFATRSHFIYGIDLQSGMILFSPFQVKAGIGTLALNDDASRFFISQFSNFNGYVHSCNEKNAHKPLIKLSQISHNSIIYHAAFCKEKEYLATSSRDGSIRFWDTKTHKEKWKPIFEPDFATHLAISENGNQLYTCYSKKKLIKWQAPLTNNKFKTKTSHKFDVALFANSPNEIIANTRTPNNEILRLSYPSHKMQILNKSDKKKLRLQALNLTLRPHSSSYFTLKHDRESIDEWDLTTGKHIRNLNPHAGPIHHLQCSHNEKLLAIAATDSVTLYDLVTETSYTLQHQKTQNVRSMVFSSDDQHIILGGNLGNIEWFDTEKKSHTRSERYGVGKIDCITIHPQKKFIALGSSDNTARVFHEDSWLPLSPVISHTNRVGVVKFLNDPKLIVTAEKGRVAQVWDIKTAEPIGPPMTHTDRIRSIDVHPDTGEILTAGYDGVIAVWNAP